MKHILKLIVGFSVVMCILWLIVLAKHYPDEFLLCFLSVVGLGLCYYLGNSVWNIIEDIYEGMR